MNAQNFNPNAECLVNAWADSIVEACNTLDFDLQCLDWFSCNPDFYIQQKAIKSATEDA